MDLFNYHSCIINSYACTCTTGQGNGAVRLYNNGVTSHTLSAGIVQIYYNGEWGNICNDEAFDLNAASVICCQLSYNGASGYISADATRFGVYLEIDAICAIVS